MIFWYIHRSNLMRAKRENSGGGRWKRLDVVEKYWCWNMRGRNRGNVLRGWLKLLRIVRWHSWEEERKVAAVIAEEEEGDEKQEDGSTIDRKWKIEGNLSCFTFFLLLLYVNYLVILPSIKIPLFLKICHLGCRRRKKRITEKNDYNNLRIMIILILW